MMGPDYGGKSSLFLGGGFKYVLNVYPYLEEMIQFDEHIFQMGWNHQLGLYLDVAWKWNHVEFNKGIY